MERVTGIGGIFFKAEDPKKLQAWYQEHLGVQPDPDGYVGFKWLEKDPPGREAVTIWSPFPKDTRYYQPSQAPFMINYRVKDLDAMLAQLRAQGIQTVGEPENSEFGRFAWVMDPEGNKIELWEPPKDK
jgi:catechol 2,3-dioxygenase-like lactoylglutathione lyase family enzyme